MADRVLVLWPGVRPEPLRWESRVQDIGRPETSQSHVLSIGESSPRDLHLYAKTQLHSTTSKLQCWTPHAKQVARQEHNPRPLAQRLPKIIIRSQTPQNTPPDVVLPTRRTRSNLIHQSTVTSPLHQEAYTSHCPTGGRHQKQRELRTCSLHKGDPKHNKLSKMRRQRNTQQMKEQSKNPPGQTNEEEIDSLPEKGFRVMIVKMIQILETQRRKYEKRLTRT